MCGGENDTNGCHLAVFNVDIAFARHFMVPHPYKSARGIGYTSKNNLKWWAIQLAIHSTVDT